MHAMSMINVSSLQHASLSYGNSRAIWYHTSVTCHLSEVTFLPLPQSIKAGTQFNEPGRVQLSGGVQAWLSVWVEMQICIWPS